jgi:hypothetical protein
MGFHEIENITGIDNVSQYFSYQYPVTDGEIGAVEDMRIKDVALAYDMAKAMQTHMDIAVSDRANFNALVPITEGLMADDEIKYNQRFGDDLENIKITVERAIVKCIVKAYDAAEQVQESVKNEKEFQEALESFGNIAEIDRFAGWHSKVAEVSDPEDKLSLIQNAKANRAAIKRLIEITGGKSLEQMSDSEIAQLIPYVQE